MREEKRPGELTRNREKSEQRKAGLKLRGLRDEATEVKSAPNSPNADCKYGRSLAEKRGAISVQKRRFQPQYTGGAKEKSDKSRDPTTHEKYS